MDEIDDKTEEICSNELCVVEKYEEIKDKLRAIMRAELPWQKRSWLLQHEYLELWKLVFPRDVKQRKIREKLITAPTLLPKNERREIRILRLREPRIEEPCCRNCIGERSRRVAAKLEGDIEKVDDVVVGSEADDDDEALGVVLHPLNRQVVISVDAPLGFELSLDFLPCFQGLEGEDSSINNGWIAGSSNGYLLCTTGMISHNQYYVCNPLTKQWVALPPATRTYRTVRIGFVFDPCCNCNDHNPFDCTNCTFRVVRFENDTWCMSQHQFEAENFSSSTGRWTISSVSSPEKFIWGLPLALHSFFFNGCLLWLLETKIVVYDPYANKFHGVIPGPVKSQCCRSDIQPPTYSIGLSRGSIWLSQFSPLSEYLRIWELKGYNDNINLGNCYWFPYRLCNFRQLMGDTGWAQECKCIQLLAIHPHDPDIVYLELKWFASCYVVSCNLRAKTFGQVMLNASNYCGQDSVTFLHPPASSTPAPSTSFT